MAESEAARSGDPARRAAAEKVGERKRERQARAAARRTGPNPTWYKVLMVALMIVGLFWVIVYYATLGQWPVPTIGAWNIVIGFGIAMVGFIMTTRWRG